MVSSRCTPAACTAIRTWPAPGRRSGISSRTSCSGPPNWCWRIAHGRNVGLQASLKSSGRIRVRTGDPATRPSGTGVNGRTVPYRGARCPSRPRHVLRSPEVSGTSLRWRLSPSWRRRCTVTDTPRVTTSRCISDRPGASSTATWAPSSTTTDSQCSTPTPRSPRSGIHGAGRSSCRPSSTSGASTTTASSSSPWRCSAPGWRCSSVSSAAASDGCRHSA